MPLSFHKMHANGDDFVLVDTRNSANPITSELARRLGDRHLGIGFNQLAVVLDCDDADARLQFWNADGSVLDVCGSATRGAADRLMREASRKSITLRTQRGLLTCERTPCGLIAVDMGLPLFDWTAIPLAQAYDTLVLPLSGDPSVCSMGNPHCTYFVDDLGTVDIASLGPSLENHPCSRARPTSISCRSSIASTFACASGNATAASRSAPAHARAVPPSTASAGACSTTQSKSNATAAPSASTGTASTTSPSAARSNTFTPAQSPTPTRRSCRRLRSFDPPTQRAVCNYATSARSTTRH